jgi:hypothetical protein
MPGAMTRRTGEIPSSACGELAEGAVAIGPSPHPLARPYRVKVERDHATAGSDGGGAAHAVWHSPCGWSMITA